jgi:hypothetical protein
MPGPQPTSIELTCKQRKILERLARRETSPQRLVPWAGGPSVGGQG